MKALRAGNRNHSWQRLECKYVALTSPMLLLWKKLDEDRWHWGAVMGLSGCWITYGSCKGREHPCFNCSLKTEKNPPLRGVHMYLGCLPRNRQRRMARCWETSAPYEVHSTHQKLGYGVCGRRAHRKVHCPGWGWPETQRDQRHSEVTNKTSGTQARGVLRLHHKLHN